MQFSTRDLPLRERRDAWNNVVGGVCGQFVIEYDRQNRDFRGEMNTRVIGGLKFAKIAHSPVKAWRSRREVDRADNRMYYLLTQLRGRARVVQNENDTVLQAGDIALIDSSRPCVFSFDPDNIQLSLHIPRELLDRHVKERVFPLATSHRGGLAAATGALARSIFDGPADYSAQQGLAAREALLKLMLSTLLEGRDPASVDEREQAPGRLAAIRDYIETHLSDPELSPLQIAQAHGISVRHLHRLVGQAGTTVGDWIRNIRLERCAADLRNPDRGEATITEIAFRWGYNDSAHFSRSFRAMFGQTARDYRKTRAG